VVGDGTYGGIRHGIVSPRPFLHAAELVFVHPITNQLMSFTSPLPDDLAAVEAQLTT
jgi:23S rRNA-/tRNA-specific pseudouridylate synthase